MSKAHNAKKSEKKVAIRTPKGKEGCEETEEGGFKAPVTQRCQIRC